MGGWELEIQWSDCETGWGRRWKEGGRCRLACYLNEATRESVGEMGGWPIKYETVGKPRDPPVLFTALQSYAVRRSSVKITREFQCSRLVLSPPSFFPSLYQSPSLPLSLAPCGSLVREKGFFHASISATDADVREHGDDGRHARNTTSRWAAASHHPIFHRRASLSCSRDSSNLSLGACRYGDIVLEFSRRLGTFCCVCRLSERGLC